MKSLDGEKKLLEKYITKIEKEKINLETMLEGTKCNLNEAEHKFESECKKYKSKINVSNIVFFSSNNENIITVSIYRNWRWN